VRLAVQAKAETKRQCNTYEAAPQQRKGEQAPTLSKATLFCPFLSLSAG